MKRLLFILGAIVLTSGLALAQHNDAKTCQIGKKNRIKVEQIGHQNEVRMHQLGFRNWARVLQEGHANEVKTKQRGTRHGIVVIQKGKHNEVDIKQGRRWWLCGPCNTGLFAKVVQKGYHNEADIEQSGSGSEIYVKQITKNLHGHGGGNTVDLEQKRGFKKLCRRICVGGCSDNLMDVYQKGRGNDVWALQEGAENELYTKQYGKHHEIGAYQLGEGNKATIIQRDGMHGGHGGHGGGCGD